MKPENWEEGSKKGKEASKPKDSPPFAYGAYLQDQRVGPIIEPPRRRHEAAKKVPFWQSRARQLRHRSTGFGKSLRDNNITRGSVASRNVN